MSIQEQTGPLRYAGQPSATYRDPTNLADLLERILDKGIVIAGDISISLVDIELLTIRLRLLVASVDKAQEMGIDWWRSDPWLSQQAARENVSAGDDRRPPGNQRSSEGQKDGDEQRAIGERLERIEATLKQLQKPAGSEATKGRRQ
ncbi:MAG: gas vesicle protein [Acidimicrobiaceae bacterium]|nr:gas vesicle protein [Acidimicrobiaceae bacterium]